MGDVLSGEELKLSIEHVKAIDEAPIPQNQSELRSFLGFVQFCAKFIPNFATLSSPLWDLVGKNVTWKWGIQEEHAFVEIKDRVTQAPVMVYFKQGAPTRLTTNASPVGLGVIIEQKQEDGTYRPVCYASRKLSKVEKSTHSSQEKLKPSADGIEFEIRTDHKPFVTVLIARS